MRVSEIYDLDQSQGALDFVDVDVNTDIAVFVDPRAIRIQQGAWHDSCIGLLQTFFHEVLIGINQQDNDRVLDLLSRLTEPNETHLGVSKGRSRGRGLGGIGAERVVKQLSESRAAQTGLLQDLEDSALLIEGIGPDIISDITTNVIRSKLISYTQQACEHYEISLEDNQYAGWVWDADKLKWAEQWAALPVVNDEILLLVPRSIVRISLIFESEKYYRRAIAPIHESLEIDAGSSLVYALKNGIRRVRTGDLIEKYGAGKSAVVEHTEQHPEALDNFRTKPGMATSPPLSHEQLAAKTRSDDVNFWELLGVVKSVLPGTNGATLYHRAIRDFLAAIFYPLLANVQTEKVIHEGRKRLDINFDNVAEQGFFKWIRLHNPASQIVVECKNYSRDPHNPALDQISGRFSPHRTQFGIIVCRQIEDKDLFAQRCRDTAKDHRGYVLFLDDDDLEELIKQYDDGKGTYLFLRDQFDFLTS